ncbi:MAG: ABC transporter ATP-binding protein [Proteobacteria bacterium]|jgi:iron complex transport system ATP-binding protein|nr:ABC transporter ATP-binding protein [Pseudomonadota bacterium]
MPSLPILEARELAIGFASRRIAGDISFALAAGESLAVLGGNGAGKSTLLRTLLGLIAPLAGSVATAGANVIAMRPAERARRLAYVPQHDAISFGFRVLDVVLMARAAQLPWFGPPRDTDRDAAHEALARLRIADLAGRSVTELSGGERQLVMIARALAQAAPVLVMDEPTASLDFGNRARVLAEIDRLRADGKSIVVSTHEPDLALAHADRALLLRDGRPLALDRVERALTAANIERLYGVAVTEIAIDARRSVFVPVPPR